MNHIISFAGVDDVAQLFENVKEDKPLARMFLYAQTQDLARVVGAKISPYSREMALIGAIRETFENDTVVIPECNCAGLGEGRRWVGADSLRPVRYSIGSSIARLFDGAENYAHEAFAFVSALAPRLQLEPVTGNQVANISVEASAYDGAGGTLGVTSFYSSNDDDLDVFSSTRPAVNILCDTSELWTPNYFRTVFRHEVLHAVGLGHAPTRDDLMYWLYLGVHLGQPGQWSQSQVDQRYRDVRIS